MVEFHITLFKVKCHQEVENENIYYLFLHYIYIKDLAF